MWYGGLCMRNFNVREFGMRWTTMPSKGEFRGIKHMLLWGFLAGLFVFCVYGREIVTDTNWLDQGTLKEIRDCSLDEKKFLEYVLAKRILLFGVGVFIWWWGLGKIYLCSVISFCGFIMGAFLWVSLYRYPFTGIFLWFFLFFPHMIFYIASMICGIMLKSTIKSSRQEKIQYLWENAWKVSFLAVLYAMGIYCESYFNVYLLQKFLKVF